jgi:hypothetical protein
MDAWIVHIHLTADIGATLHIEGPSFGGIAHVDLWFVALNILQASRANSEVTGYTHST